jgi:hypothetical protein
MGTDAAVVRRATTFHTMTAADAAGPADACLPAVRPDASNCLVAGEVNDASLPQPPAMTASAITPQMNLRMRTPVVFARSCMKPLPDHVAAVRRGRALSTSDHSCLPYV